jgi:hypothetical protein
MREPDCDNDMMEHLAVPSKGEIDLLQSYPLEQQLAVQVVLLIEKADYKPIYIYSLSSHLDIGDRTDDHGPLAASVLIVRSVLLFGRLIKLLEVEDGGCH